MPLLYVCKYNIFKLIKVIIFNICVTSIFAVAVRFLLCGLLNIYQDRQYT